MLRRLSLSLLIFGLIAAAIFYRAEADEKAQDAMMRKAIEAIGATVDRAQGTYSIAQRPQMCVAIHPTTSPEQNLALLKKLHADCARTDNSWDQIEREIGRYDWKNYDAIWLPLCQAHIRPIMIATYNNPLYAAGPFRAIAGEPNIKAFTKFSVAMVEHYADACPGMIIELFNEPNAVNWTTVPWSGTAYAAMLAPVAEAIKKARPHVTVFSGGLGFDAQNPDLWISDMVRSGGGFPSVDAYAFHPYQYDEKTPAKTLPPEMLLIDAGRFADHANPGNPNAGNAKPVALTEYGFPLQALGGDLKKQGRYVARAMLAAIVGRYPYQTLYDLVDDGINQRDVQNTFGLFRGGVSDLPYDIKPSGAAFTTVMHALENAKSIALDYDAKAMIPSLTFEKPQGRAIAVWTLDASEPKTFSRAIGPAKKVACTNAFGAPYPCRYQDETVSLTFRETDAPIMIEALR